MKWRWSKLVVVVMLMAMLTISLSGCGGSKDEKKPDAAAGPKGKVMIYTSIYPDIIEKIKPELKKAFPNVEVEWFQAGTEKVMAKVAGEIEANKVQADLLMVADPS